MYEIEDLERDSERKTKEASSNRSRLVQGGEVTLFLTGETVGL